MDWVLAAVLVAGVVLVIVVLWLLGPQPTMRDGMTGDDDDRFARWARSLPWRQRTHIRLGAWWIRLKIRLRAALADSEEGR